MPNMFTDVTKVNRSSDHFIMIESPCTTSFLSTQQPSLQVGFKTRIPYYFLVCRSRARRASLLCSVTFLVAAYTELQVIAVTIIDSSQQHPVFLRTRLTSPPWRILVRTT